MKTLDDNFDFFDYTPKEISKENQEERQKRIAIKDAEIKEKIEKRQKRLRYEKSYFLRLG